MQHGPNLLDERPIQSLSNTVVLGSIMYGEFLSRTGILQMKDEFFAQILATAVGVKDFDPSTVLGDAPSLVLFVG